MLLLLIFFGIATLVQLLVWGGLFRQFQTAMPKQGIPIGDFPDITVLICARNESENLRKNLPAIARQDYPGSVSILVIDDNSTDDTANVVREIISAYPWIKLLQLTEKSSPGKKEALRCGIAAATTEWLVFTDADCMPVGNAWLRAMVAVRKEYCSMVLGYGPMYPQAGLLGKWVEFEVVYTALQYISMAEAGMPYMGVGRNIAWKKSLFRMQGGFDSHLDLASGDDDLFVNAAAKGTNVALCTSPESFLYSAGKKSWKAWFYQKKRHLTAGKRYKTQHQFVLTAISMSHCVHYGLLFILSFCGYHLLWLCLAYLLRIAFVLPAYARAFRQLHAGHLLVWAPLLDGMLAIWFGSFVPLLLLWDKLQGKDTPQRW